MPNPPSTIDYPFQEDPGTPADFPFPAGGAPSQYNGGQDPYPYIQYLVTVSWCWDTGWRAQPLAGPDGTPPKMVKLYAAKGTKVVRYRVRRLGALPVLPDPSPDPNDGTVLGLITAVVKPFAPPQTGDGLTYVYGARGRYVYALRAPLTPTQGYPVPALPFSAVTKTYNLLDQSRFSQQIT